MRQLRSPHRVESDLLRGGPLLSADEGLCKRGNHHYYVPAGSRRFDGPYPSILIHRPKPLRMTDSA